MLIKKKRSQITIFMILGIVMIIIVLTLIMVSRNVAKKTTSKEALESKEIAFDVQPIKNYVEECLSLTSKDGLIKMGKQGGYIFKSQGGTIVDYSEEGKFFANSGGYKVVYNIFQPRFQVGNFKPLVPDYPWKNFPYNPDYPNALSGDKEYEGQNAFGTNAMPHLRRSHGAHSIQEQLEVFVDSNIGSCLDFSVFEEQGFSISKNGEREVMLEINEEDIVFKMNYPLIVDNLVSGEKTEIKEFLVKHDVRLKKLHNFVNDIINLDVSDVTFDISTGSAGSFTVERKRDEYAKDDLIIVTDIGSYIDGKPYKYYFMRKNRAPALEYSDIDVIYPSYCTYDDSDPLNKKVDCDFIWKEQKDCVCDDDECTSSSCRLSYKDIKPTQNYPATRERFKIKKAAEPDEDSLDIFYENEKDIPARKDGGDITKVIQKVKDDKPLIDQQTTTFDIYWKYECSGDCCYSSC